MPSVPSRHAFRPLRIGGLQAMTTLDYPDHLACVLFCQGCAWRCRYCHNPELIRCGGPTEWSWNKVLGFLRQRQGLLQAVVFSGGEATLQPALPSAMRRVRELGFDRPVFARDEGFDFLLPLHDHAQRRRLHPARRQTALHFAPQHR